jgi:hypothetical protein
VQVALVQGGLAAAECETELQTMGGMFLEPLSRISQMRWP